MLPTDVSSSEREPEKAPLPILPKDKEARRVIRRAAVPAPGMEPGAHGTGSSPAQVSESPLGGVALCCSWQ